MEIKVGDFLVAKKNRYETGRFESGLLRLKCGKAYRVKAVTANGGAQIDDGLTIDNVYFNFGLDSLFYNAGSQPISPGSIVVFESGRHGIAQYRVDNVSSRLVTCVLFVDTGEVVDISDDWQIRHESDEDVIMEIYFPERHAIGLDLTLRSLGWKRKKVVKMTLEEISSALGYDVEIDKGDKE